MMFRDLKKKNGYHFMLQMSQVVCYFINQKNSVFGEYSSDI